MSNLAAEFLSTPSVGRATAGAEAARTAASKFLSTPSVGRATLSALPRSTKRTYFYPRPPWGGRLIRFAEINKTDVFLSTPSVGRATGVARGLDDVQHISIHALRGEGDCAVSQHREPVVEFLSTPSVGRATMYSTTDEITFPFLSTPSVGRATPAGRRGCRNCTYFYPRPPWGGRRPRHPRWRTRLTFLSTPSVGRATARKRGAFAVHAISIHALRGEGDPPGKSL